MPKQTPADLDLTVAAMSGEWSERALTCLTLLPDDTVRHLALRALEANRALPQSLQHQLGRQIEDNAKTADVTMAYYKFAELFAAGLLANLPPEEHILC